MVLLAYWELYSNLALGCYWKEVSRRLAYVFIRCALAMVAQWQSS